MVPHLAVVAAVVHDPIHDLKTTVATSQKQRRGSIQVLGGEVLDVAVFHQEADRFDLTCSECNEGGLMASESNGALIARIVKLCDPGDIERRVSKHGAVVHCHAPPQMRRGPRHDAAWCCPVWTSLPLRVWGGVVIDSCPHLFVGSVLSPGAARL
jgi:hypothetical protein